MTLAAFSRRAYNGNAVPTTIPAGLSAGANSFVIANATGWPDGTTGKFMVVLNDGLQDIEKVACSGRTGTTVNVDAGGRGYDGSVAQLHGNNCTVMICAGAQDLDEANNAVNQTIGAVTTKGDLLIASAANTLARLAAGGDYKQLRARAAATNGLEYAFLFTELAKSISYALNPFEEVWFTTGASTLIATLPAPGTAGLRYKIGKADSGTGGITITTPSGLLLGVGLGAGGLTAPLFGQGDSVEIVDDGTNYRIAGNADSGWINPANGAFSSPWVNGNGGTGVTNFGYRIIGNRAILRGCVTGGSSATALISIAALAPKTNQNIQLLGVTTSGAPTATNPNAMLSIPANSGALGVYFTSVGGLAGFDFDGVSYLVD